MLDRVIHWVCVVACCAAALDDTRGAATKQEPTYSQALLSIRHGAQGTLDGASNAVMDNEFGTHVDEDVIKQILEKGTLQESEFAERQGRKNDANGPYVA